MPTPVLHTNASTTLRQRVAIRDACVSGILDPVEMATELVTSVPTIYKWSGRPAPLDRPSGRPKGTGAFQWSDDLVGVVLFYRNIARLSAIDIEQALRMDEESLVPSDTTIHRKLVELGKNRLPGREKRAVQAFEATDLGYLHVDLFYTPDIYGGRRFCITVIERVSRMLYSEILPDRTEMTVKSAFERAIDFYPCSIHTVLSDNGSEFGLRGRASDRELGLFDEVCRRRGIKHKRTKPATPQTNGLAERMNGLTKENTGLATAEVWRSLLPMPAFGKILQSERTHTPLDSARPIPPPIALRLAVWVVFWNEVRPSRQLGWKTPLEKMKALYLAAPACFHRPPSATIKDLDRLNDNLGGQRLSFHCSQPPVKRAFLLTSL